MEVMNDTNEDVEYTDPASQCRPLAAGASEQLSGPGVVRFHASGSGDCSGELLAEADVPRDRSVKLTYCAVIV